MIQACRINDRGITLQRPTLLQTPGKHAGDEGTFAGCGSFLLHQRGEGDDVVQLLGRCPEVRGKLGVEHVAKARQHCRHYRGGAHTARESVRVGEEIAFERGRLRVEVTDRGGLLSDAQEFFGLKAQLLVEDAGHIEPVRAFRDDHAVEVHIALDELSIHIDGAQRPVKEVFTGRERATRAPKPVADEKRPTAFQHPARDEYRCSLGSVGAGFKDKDQIAGVPAIGTVQLSPRPAEPRRGQDDEEEREPFPHGSASEARRRWLSF